MAKYVEMKLEELVKLANSLYLPLTGEESVEDLAARLEACDKPESYAINAMRKALCVAYADGNNHAITKDEAIAAGTTEERWAQWKVWCNSLKDVVDAYVEIKWSLSTPVEEKLAKRELIYPRWRQILKVGTEDKFHKNLWFDETDVDSLVAFDEVFRKTVVGKLATTNSETIFRRQVETMLGIKMSGNQFMSAKMRDTIAEFKSAEMRIDNCVKALEGYDDANGTHVPGARETVVNLEKQIEESKAQDELLLAFGVSKEQLLKVTKTVLLDNDLKAAKNRVSQLEANKVKAEAVKAKLQDKVTAFEDTLNTLAEDGSVENLKKLRELEQAEETQPEAK